MATFDDSVRASHAIEAVENYSRADAPLERTVPLLPHSLERMECHGDNDFWSHLFWAAGRNPNHIWGMRFEIRSSYLTEWVARVPGLFWTPGAKVLRERAEEFVESRSKVWTTYKPVGKSQKVAGGIGTLCLPPDTQGYRLATLSCGMNASSGIPVLLSPDQWDQAQQGMQAEGRHIDRAVGTWQKAGFGWAERFETIKGLPQGYLVVEQLRMGDHNGPVQFHPFSVMEYETEHSKLFDFVYITVDLGGENWRGEVETFFECYRTHNGRNGRYLTAANSGDHLWDADFATPKELRRASAAGRTQLDLLIARVQERLAGTDLIEGTLAKLGQVCDEVQDLAVYSAVIEIPSRNWRSDDALIDNISRFVGEVQKRPGKMEELILRIGDHYPELN